MPKKIENPLYGGLPAKIYILCYVEPRSGYALAKEIYGHHRTDKIYKSFKKFSNYYEYAENRYSVKIGLLVSEIQYALQQKNSKLKPTEEKQLKELLESKEFKEYVGGFYKNFEHEREITDDGKHFEKIKQDFNALKLISETIGMVSTLFYINKKFKNRSPKIDVTKQENRYKKSSLNWKDLSEGDIQFNAVLPFFAKFNEETFLKLNTLWPPSRTIIMSEFVDYWNKTSEIICPKCSYKIKRRLKI